MNFFIRIALVDGSVIKSDTITVDTLIEEAGSARAALGEVNKLVDILARPGGATGIGMVISGVMTNVNPNNVLWTQTPGIKGFLDELESSLDWTSNGNVS